MKNPPQYYQQILGKFIANTASRPEVEELLAFIREEPLEYRRLLDSPVIEMLLSEQAENEQIPVAEALSNRMRERLLTSISADRPGEAPVYEIRPKRRSLAWTAAAAILILVLGGAYFFVVRNKKQSALAVQQNQQTTQPDIAPGGNKAILFLPGGQKIILDSAKNGQLAKLGTTKVIKTDSGKLLYAVADNNIAEPVGMNTLATPRGGIYQITLPDGTQAWLNAESSITYPTRFNQTERNVSVTGEVYFEVAKDAAHPFIVSLADKTKDQDEAGHWMQVEVLGTHFNINAYSSNESGLAKTTLLEGSVKVSAHGQSRMIRPGEQAATAVSSKSVELKDKIDLDKVMAWKNGEMSLTSSSVEQIMQEISRWYDVDIKFAGAVPVKNFYGSIDRNVPLSTVLKGLRAYGVETRLEGKTIIVQ